MALAVISTAFTGQAIAVAFDRRYGRSNGWCHRPPGMGNHRRKALAVVTVVFLQAILLGGIGLALGWRPPLVGLALGAVIIALGTAAFAAMGCCWAEPCGPRSCSPWRTCCGSSSPGSAP